MNVAGYGICWTTALYPRICSTKGKAGLWRGVVYEGRSGRRRVGEGDKNIKEINKWRRLESREEGGADAGMKWERVKAREEADACRRNRMFGYTCCFS